MLRGLAGGVVAGLVWGVVARVFMRLVSTSPEFSWSGTLFILAVAAVAGAAIGTVRAARVTGRSRWWRLAGIPTLVLFAGPGALLLPGAVGTALLVSRPWWLRLAGTVPFGWMCWYIGTSDPTPTGRETAGLLLIVACVAVLGLGLRELVLPWRPRASSEVAPQPAQGTAPPRVLIMGG